MGKGKMTNITPIQFSILHKNLIEACYGEKANEVTKWSDVELYGHNPTQKNPRKNSLHAKIGLDIGPRVLSNAVNRFHRGQLHNISQALVNQCLVFLGFESLSKMEKDFRSENNLPNYEAPDRLQYSSDSRPINRDNGDTDKLNNLANTRWWYYAHIPRSGHGGTRVVKHLLRITDRQANGDCNLILENEAPYTSFSGRIIKRYSSGNVLTCELSSVNKVVQKRLYLLIHVDPDASKDLYIGCFLRHTDGGKIYGGSLVLEKNNTIDTHKEPNRKAYDVLKFINDPGNNTKNSILNFLYSSQLNYLKIPSYIYTIEDFVQWMGSKTGVESYRMPVYDLYIAAPFRGFPQQISEFEEIKKDIVKDIIGLVKEQAGEVDLKESKVNKLLNKHLSEYFLDRNQLSFDDMNNQISLMIEELKGKKIGFKNICYPYSSDDFAHDRKLDSSKVLLRQLSKFNQSKRLLFILPFSMVSSVFIEIGWAMISQSNIPVFIVANRNDLPFLIRKADTLKNRHIYLVSWEEIEKIENIPNWIFSNEYHKLS